MRPLRASASWLFGMVIFAGCGDDSGDGRAGAVCEASTLQSCTDGAVEGDGSTQVPGAGTGGASGMDAEPPRDGGADRDARTADASMQPGDGGLDAGDAAIDAGQDAASDSGPDSGQDAGDGALPDAAASLCDPDPCTGMRARECDPQTGACVCAHECAQEGDGRCEDGMLSECELDGADCRVWGEPAGCGAAFCFDETHCGKKTFGDWGSGTDCAPDSVVIDATGQVFVAGSSRDEGLHGLTGLGSGDVFLSKWSPAGTRIWTRLWGTSGPESPRAMAIGPNDEIVISGTTGGSLSGPISGIQDCYAVLWPANMTDTSDPTWDVQLGGEGTDQCYAAAFGNDGDLFLGGKTTSILGAPGMSTSGDAVLWRLNAATGATLDGLQWGGTFEDIIYGLAMSDDALYVAGNRDYTVSAEGEMYLAKRTADGATESWQSRWNATGNDYATGVVIDADGDAIVSGESPGGLLGAAAGGVVVKVGPAQEERWAHGGFESFANFIALAPDGRSFYAGNNDGSVEKRSADGELIWTTLGLAGAGRVIGLAVAPDGRLVVIGYVPGIPNIPYITWIGPE